VKKRQGSATADSKFGELERARAKIDRDDFMGGSHGRKFPNLK
jgi:hypothetical protein